MPVKNRQQQDHWIWLKMADITNTLIRDLSLILRDCLRLLFSYMHIGCWTSIQNSIWHFTNEDQKAQLSVQYSSSMLPGHISQGKWIIAHRKHLWQFATRKTYSLSQQKPPNLQLAVSGSTAVTSNQVPNQTGSALCWFHVIYYAQAPQALPAKRLPSCPSPCTCSASAARQDSDWQSLRLIPRRRRQHSCGRKIAATGGCCRRRPLLRAGLSQEPELGWAAAVQTAARQPGSREA